MNKKVESPEKVIANLAKMVEKLQSENSALKLKLQIKDLKIEQLKLDLKQQKFKFEKIIADLKAQNSKPEPPNIDPVDLSKYRTKQ